MTRPDDPNGDIHHAPLGALIGPDATTAGLRERDALRAEVEDLRGQLTDAIRQRDTACKWLTRLRGTLSDIATVTPGTYAGSVAREALLDELTVGAARRHGKKREVQA